MTYDDALVLLDKHLHSNTLKKHCLATQAIMRELARRFQEDEETWAIAGLLHDLDYEITKDVPSEHGKKTVEILDGTDLSPEVKDAILRHNAEALGLERITRLDYALTCAETITGLVVAAALVHPEKKIAAVKVKSIKKRMKSKDFARSVNRDHIRLCEKIDVPLDDFIALSLKAMSDIASELGL
ncbi:HDIG domain-containing metalloprotein [Desulfosoma caldarium]|uniref:Putative nucleotidyltransferase with HDIG domain n=1 Tax=Desulfosoma caldarium TaxID=610254 RepID=A0A3N1VPY4_9BACT|nr:HDIG domain-containing metalloprotein [Desulfosoma caldarium]ROR03111.1 putative nucleotidyltransferase with HDIG domain [Desulfosoma caldarium]